jgi:hypothetical protein
MMSYETRPLDSMTSMLDEKDWKKDSGTQDVLTGAPQASTSEVQLQAACRGK